MQFSPAIPRKRLIKISPYFSSKIHVSSSRISPGMPGGHDTSGMHPIIDPNQSECFTS
jgi:hypothetical protein